MSREKSFREEWTENEPTCPGGGLMQWIVDVEEPDLEIGSTHAMISVTETATNQEHGQDVLVLGVDDTEKLIEVLQRAVIAAREAEKKAASL